jgi:hypothetical protein
LALITGYFLDRFVNGSSVVALLWPRLAFAVFSLAGLCLTVALPIAIHDVLPGEEALSLLGLIPLAAGIFCVLALARERRKRAALGFAVGSAALVLGIFAVGAPQVARHQKSAALLATVRERVGDTPLASFGCLEPTWVFYSGQRIEELAFDEKPLGTRSWIQVGSAWQRKPAVTVREWLAARPESAIITSEEHADTLRPLLPSNYRVIAEASYFLQNQKLLVFAATAPAVEVPARLSAHAAPVPRNAQRN